MNLTPSKRKLVEFLFNSSSSSSSDSEEEIKKKRKFWVHPYHEERDIDGAFVSIFGSITAINDPAFFLKYVRMSSSQLEELLIMVGPIIEKETLIRVPISAKLRLVLKLR